jgi:Tfp pilus assembly protein PilX
MRRKRADRRGLTLVAALVCLIVVGLICASLLRLAHAQRSQVRGLEHQAQAEWLAESGLDRAVTRLQDDRSYTGEMWSLAPDALGGRYPGVVRIVVSSTNSSTTRTIRVEADYPAGSGDEARARQSRTLIVDLGPDSKKGPS